MSPVALSPLKQTEAYISARQEKYWQDEAQTARNKRVLLVEGDDDREVIEQLLRQRSQTWSVHVHIISSAGRDKVLARLRHSSDKSTIRFPHGFGLVDRDTWTDEEAAKLHIQEPRLYVTAGWSLENSFLDPQWLTSYDSQIADLLESKRDLWVRAGALWWTLQRTRDAQQRWQELLQWNKGYGAPPDPSILDLSSPQALLSGLKQRLETEVCEAAAVDLEAIASRYDERCREMLAKKKSEQWRLGVHGKRAFKGLLLPALQKKRSGKINWRAELAAHVGRPMPPPLDELIAMLLA